MEEIHLFDLPREIRIEFTENYRNKIFESVKTKELVNILKVRRETVRRWKRGEVLPTIADLIEISRFIRLDTNELERNVKSFRAKKGFINNPKLPLKLSSDIGLIIGGVLGDGGITSKHCKLFYANKNEMLVNSFIAAVQNIFGDIKYRLILHNDGVKVVEITSIVGKILLKVLGLPRGDKTLLNYKLPNLLFETQDKLLVIKFLRRFYDDEGYVHKAGAIVLRMSIEKSLLDKIPNRFLGLSLLLNKLDIKTSKPAKINERFRIARGNPRANPTIVEDWEIKIYHKKYLTKFLETIGFESKHKSLALRTIIENITREEAPHGEGLMFYLELAREFRKLFSLKDIKTKSNRKSIIVAQAIRKLKTLSLLREVGKLPGTGSPKLYEITEKGKSIEFVEGKIK
jgi:hypothetical protein